MANSLEIVSDRNGTFSLVVDGNRLEDIQGYELSESADNMAILKVAIYIKQSVTVKIE